MVGKHAYLRSLIEQQSARTMAAYLYSSAGCGESTTDIVFAGNGIIAENGAILRESERFTFGEQLTLCDVDIERLMALRRKTNTFTSESPQKRNTAASVPDYRFRTTPGLPCCGKSAPILSFQEKTHTSTNAVKRFSTFRSAVWPNVSAIRTAAQPSSAFREASTRRWLCWLPSAHSTNSGCRAHVSQG